MYFPSILKLVCEKTTKKQKRTKDKKAERKYKWAVYLQSFGSVNCSKGPEHSKNSENFHHRDRTWAESNNVQDWERTRANKSHKNKKKKKPDETLKREYKMQQRWNTRP